MKKKKKPARPSSTGKRKDKTDRKEKADMIPDPNDGVVDDGDGIEPWPEPVDGRKLLARFAGIIKRHVSLRKGEPRVLALWALHTYVFSAADVTPRLLIRSPVPGCGKTELMNVLASLVSNPLLLSNASTPGFFRSADKPARPTLLFDEADTSLPENTELRGILNSGHRSGSVVIRCAGEEHDPRYFSTFCPVALALLESLHPTLEARSIRINMRGKLPEDPVVRFNRTALAKDLQRLCRQAARWAKDHFDHLVNADPEMPEFLQNREGDNWRILFAIADLVGGPWPEGVRRLSLKFVSGSQDDELPLGVQLLADIRDLLAKKDWISSEQLVQRLRRMEDRPWPDHKGAGITKSQVARMLRPFGILPKTLRISKTETAKGYRREWFDDAFTRYLPPLEP